MSIKTFTLAAIAASAVTTAAIAQSVSAHDPDSIVWTLQDMGYRASLDTDNSGDPKILSALDGINYTIFFYSCDDNHNNCRDIQFSSGFEVDPAATIDMMNTWNRDRAVGKAFINDNNNPVVQHFVAGVDGMSRYDFERTFLRWETALTEFTDHIGW